MVLTFPRATVKFDSHADRAGVFAVRDEANFTGDERQL